MDSNIHSAWRPVGDQATGQPDRQTPLAAATEELAAQDLDRLPDAALAEDTIWLRQQLDRLEGQWLRRLAAVDARGAAGAEVGEQAASTAGWLRRRLRLGPARPAAPSAPLGRCSGVRCRRRWRPLWADTSHRPMLGWSRTAPATWLTT